MRVFGCQTHARNESERRWEPSRAHHRPIRKFTDGFEYEHSCWDPKGETAPDTMHRESLLTCDLDGELCLNRVKPEETLVEARSGSDVQIDRQIWV